MKTIKIMLDPGHAGSYYNASPVVSGYYESNMTWALAHKLKKALEERGFEVGLTRQTKDEDPELTERGRRARGYDLFLSLHSNASASEASNAPWIIHFRPDYKTNIDEKSKEVAEILGPVISKAMGTDDPFYYIKSVDFDRDGNGYLDDEYYGVLFGAKSVGVPGVILEHSFHTNIMSTMWLMNDKNLDYLAKVEADALAKYYNMEVPMTVEEIKRFEALEKKVEELAKKNQELLAKEEKLSKKVADHHDQIGVKWAYVDENLPKWAAPTIEKLVKKGYLNGNENNSFELSRLLMRILVILDRAGLFK